jgi:hypothetical protein
LHVERVGIVEIGRRRQWFASLWPPPTRNTASGKTSVKQLTIYKNARSILANASRARTAFYCNKVKPQDVEQRARLIKARHAPALLDIPNRILVLNCAPRNLGCRERKLCKPPIDKIYKLDAVHEWHICH